MSGKVLSTAEEIRALRIQGANAIAREALIALAEDLRDGADPSDRRPIEILISARPNEPMLRNLLDKYLEIISGVESREEFMSLAEKLLAEIDDDARALAEAGSKLILDGMNVFTHCHSSSAVSVLREANRRGRKFKVLNTETRPRFQGRITAKELVLEGVEVRHMVDSAAKYALDGADLFIFGADAVLHSGYLINKVGTGIFSVVAAKYDVPTYCATHTLKVVRDKLDEKVEERSPDEVWVDPPEGIEIFNPAFDKVHLKYVTAFVTERGVVKDILALAPLSGQ